MPALCLIRSRRVGPATFHRLIREHGSAPAALRALPSVAAAAGASNYVPCPEAVAQEELRAGARLGAQLICWGDAGYPAQLTERDDAPPVLWALGDMSLMARPAIAVVGARNASSIGMRMAAGLSRGLSEAGFVVVAGLARGVDTSAHKAALSGGTIAVMAGGLDQIYPRENIALAREIGTRGLLLTEYAPGARPAARCFPARNRIVSGLSHAVLVVEAAHRSGSLITARDALDQGREVMAVPGHPMDARAAGCNALLRDGARLIRNAADVIEGLPEGIVPHDPTARPTTPDPPRPPDHFAANRSPPVKPENPAQAILERLSATPIDENEILRELGLGPSEAAPVILELELEGMITRQSGGRLALAV